METHRKKKLEIVVEATLLPRLTALVRAEGASGFTVLPTLVGEGHSGEWSTAGLSPALSTRMLVVVAEAARAERIAAAAHELLADYAGIILLSEVEVIREDHF